MPRLIPTARMQSGQRCCNCSLDNQSPWHRGDQTNWQSSGCKKLSGPDVEKAPASGSCQSSEKLILCDSESESGIKHESPGQAKHWASCWRESESCQGLHGLGCTQLISLLRTIQYNHTSTCSSQTSNLGDRDLRPQKMLLQASILSARQSLLVIQKLPIV